MKFYNLDVILSVGYRVNSKKGTRFRIWATQRLKEHLVKGYSINQQRFKQNAIELQHAMPLIQKAAQSPLQINGKLMPHI
ncbi:MAG: RhuM family protein [Desulfotignum sp.]